jgi:hypothetical protein
LEVIEMIAALIIVAAFLAFVWAAIKSSVRWVAVGLALMTLVAAFDAAASLLGK